MTRKELRNICEELGKGGQTRLANLLGWDASTIRRKLHGDTEITKSDALAIENAVSKYNNKGEKQ